MDVGYRASGVMRVACTASERNAIAGAALWQRQNGLRVQELDGPEARAYEPELSAAIVGGVRFPDDARIDPPSLMRAIRIAAERAGVQFRVGAAVRRVISDRERARGVLLEDGTRIDGDWTVLAAGSWSTLIEGTGIEAGAVRPARGQIVELAPPTPPLHQVVFGPGCYLSPRDDGRVLVGSTTEFVGYVPAVTARAVRELLASAIALVPALADAPLGRTWAGLRPHTRDELPILGLGKIRNLILATGHFRNGVLLAPLTAKIVAALALDQAPPVDLGPFASDRLGLTAA
jgi:glycine oxidase